VTTTDKGTAMIKGNVIAKPNERGYAFLLVLLFMMVGSLVITPLLGFMGTGLKAGITFESKMDDLYAADAGIEDAKWQIRSGKIDSLTTPISYSPYDFSTSWPYDLTQPVNGVQPVHVTIGNVWIPKDIPAPSTVPTEVQARAVALSPTLVVTGTTVQTGVLVSGVYISQYRINVTYEPPASGDNLTVQQFGVWLPPGFTYYTDSTHKSNLEDLALDAQHRATPVPYVQWAGNEAAIWTFGSPPKLTSFPSPWLTGSTSKVLQITFWLKPLDQANRNIKPDAVAWTKTGGNNSLPFAWDANIRVFRIQSVANNTTVESYMARNEMRKLEAAVNGDYFAAGNTLMVPSGSIYYRDRLFKESSATIRTAADAADRKGIPANATVEYAYLYWSGWQESGSTGTTIMSDDCSNFTTPPVNWNRSSSGAAGSQTRVPTTDVDGSTRGTWTASPNSPLTLWDKVDETTFDDVNYITGVPNKNGNGRQLFVLSDLATPPSSFTVPAGSTVTGITVYVRARDASIGDVNDIRPSIMVHGKSYDAPVGNDPGASFVTYTYQWTQNPDNNSPWTVADINGTGGRPLEQIGAYSSDLTPDVSVSMVYALVNYTGPGGSCWSISSGQFRGQGSSTAGADDKTLTLVDSLNLSSYAPGTVKVSWEQTTSGLQLGDTFYYAFSWDGGLTWGPNNAVSSGTPIAPITVPNIFLTSAFRMRLYFNFTNSGSYVNIDNISVTVVQDPVVARKVDRVMFRAEDPVTGTGTTTQLVADEWSTQANPGASAAAWSYACFKDVTALVKGTAGVNANGSARYTLGHVIDNSGPTSYDLRSATSSGTIVDHTTYPLSIPAANYNDSRYQYTYGGWSLVIIYSSPDTLGRQLYLFDLRNGYFRYVGLNTALTFPISGFIAPPSTAGSHLTYFVGEGDNHYSGDFMTVNGLRLPQPGDPYEVPSINPQDNIFNSYSNSLDDPYLSGVDIDTFDMSTCVAPGSSTATVVLDNGNEIYDLVYIILAFRSETTTSGAFTYTIR
jgi:hypothetical protein